mmetsp:Transcript_31548/g.39247  ORF Transcript_31548/g.39247 Transcript_31548/m.39247 type:complete len:208 (+) Transcript_31548:1951-2574(+)
MTHDARFMIKTIKYSELLIMLDMLPNYIEHHLKYPESLIGKIFGVFTAKREGMEPVYMALMENTVQLKQPKMLRYKFDLKGSTFDRKTKGVVTSKTDRKDLDWLELKKKTKLLRISPINKHINHILRRDVDFLKKRGLIDYSFLIAIEYSTEKFKPQKEIEKRIRAGILRRSASKSLHHTFADKNEMIKQIEVLKHDNMALLKRQSV